MAFDSNGPIGRMMQRISGSDWFRRVGPRIVPPVDRFVHKLSGGRWMASRLLLPSAVLTTTGRRSGEPRSTPLASIPLDGVLHVVGSNYGKPKHPAWTWNLLANPRCTVSFGGETYTATAELLDGTERADAWRQLCEVWPLYDDYESGVDRQLRVFRLVRED